jgi:hypothetical protein
MPDARQFAPAEIATSAACATYLMQASLHGTHFAQRHQQVIDAVSRRQLSPAQVEDTLRTTADWSTARHRIDAALSSFVQSLSRHPLLPHEHAASAPHEIAVQSAEVFERSHDDVHALTALFTKLAQPDTTASARRRALSRLNVSSTNHTIAEAADAWFALLDALGGATLQALTPALLAALRAAQPIGYDREVIELAGAVSSHTSTELSIENTLERPASLHCHCETVRRADGVGPSFAPQITVSPGRQVLDARNEGAVAISIWLDDTQFAAHTTYVGALSVESDGGTHIRIPLRITTAPASA